MLRHVQEMVIYGVSFDMVGKQPIVLLKTVDSNKFLPIWIGHPEAAAMPAWPLCMYAGLLPPTSTSVGARTPA